MKKTFITVICVILFSSCNKEKVFDGPDFFQDDFETYYDKYRRIMWWMQMSTDTRGNRKNFTKDVSNFDQRYVASELEVGRSTLSTWENGLTEVKIETLIKLAVILKLENYRQIIDFDPDSLFSNK